MKEHSLMSSIVVLAIGLVLPACKKSEQTMVAGPPPTGPVELKLKWPVGSRVVQSLDLQQLAEVFLPGVSAPMRQEMTLGEEYALTVRRARSDGGVEVEMEMLGVRLKGQVGTQTLDSDSSKTKADPISTTLGKLLGARIVFFLDASNEVWKVEGIEDFHARMAGQQDSAGILRNLFNENSLKQMIDQARGMPANPVAPGDSWPAKLEISMGDLGVMEVNYTYTLKSWERRDQHNCARIEFSGTLTSKPGQTLQASGMKLDVQGGKGSGETWFDLERGMFLDSSITQELTMHLITPSQKITNVLHQVINLKRKPD